MHLNKIGMYQITSGGICLRGETVSLKMEFVAENIFRMWTTLQEDFRQEETLVVERTAFDYPNVRITEQDNLVLISTQKLTACIHLEPFYVEVRDTIGNLVFSTPEGETISWTGEKLTQRFDLQEETCVYGLGQSSIADLDLRGWERRMWHQGSVRWQGFPVFGMHGFSQQGS